MVERGYSPSCATARSSRWSSSTPRSPNCSNGSTSGGSAAPRVAALAVRAARPAGTVPAARQPLRLRRVEGRPGEHRLPRRGRRALLLGPARARPPPTRRPTDGPHRRVLPSRPARRQPCSLAAPGAPHDRSRAYAREAPPDGRMDTRPLHRLGREDRTGHRRPDHRRPRPPSSPAGLPLLHRAPALGQVLRRRRLEAAAARALAIDSCSYRGVESILRHRLDEAHAEPLEPAEPVDHDNIRGALYYQVMPERTPRC